MGLKVIHFLVVTAISLTIYGYASYFSTPPILIRPVSTPSLLPDKNNTISLQDLQPEQWKGSIVNSTAIAMTLNNSSVAASSQLNVASSASPLTVQNATQNSSRPDPNKGVKTRMFYVAGHVQPHPEICPDLGANLKLLVLIMSAPSHLDARMAIRQTWGHFASRSDVAIAFLLGKTENNTLEQKIANEGGLYMDIIRGNFLDSYNNLTLKTVSMMEWVSEFCSNAKYTLKTDDDMFINIPKLLSFVERHTNKKKTIYGRLAKRWKPIRNAKSKYFVSRNQFKSPLFPDFTTGPAYLFPSSLASLMYKTALDETYLKLEDVFMTGVVAQKLKITRSHAKEFWNKRIPMNACIVQRAITIHMVKFGEQFDLWKKLLDGRSKCK